MNKRMSEILQKNQLNEKSTSKKTFKRISAAALAATVVFSTPSVLTALNDGNPVSGAEVYAAEVTNLMNSKDVLTQFHVNHNDNSEFWAHRFHNDGDIQIDGPDFDLTGLTYVVKFPDELSHLLENDFTLDYLLGNIKNFDSAQNAFTFTGIAIDQNGEEVTIHKDDHKTYDHVSVNKATNSIEFDFASFYEANQFEPYIRQDVNGNHFFNTLGFQTPIIVSDQNMLHNGAYTFKSAIVRGKSVNLDNVSNAHEEVLNIDYSTDPVPEVNKSMLTSVVEEAKAYAEADYTEASFVALQNALTASEEVLANDKATQEEVDEVLSALQLAITGLEKNDPTAERPIDTAALESLIEKAKQQISEDYTAETYEALLNAIQSAEALLASDEVTAEAVQEVLDTLQVAIDGLKEAVEEKTEGSTENKQPNNEVEEDEEEGETIIVDKETSTGNGQLLPKTATSTYTMGLIGTLLAVTGGVFVFIRKRFTNLFN